MKVRWYIEGAGCPFHQCGLKEGHTLTIDDADLPNDPAVRDKVIDDIVQETFDQQVYPTWEALEG